MDTDLASIYNYRGQNHIDRLENHLGANLSKLINCKSLYQLAIINIHNAYPETSQNDPIPSLLVESQPHEALRAATN